MDVGCEVSGEAKMTEKKFTIKLLVRDEGTTTKLWLRIDNVSSLSFLSFQPVSSYTDSVLLAAFQCDCKTSMLVLHLIFTPTIQLPA